MLALRVVMGIARTISERVTDLRRSPLSEQPMKRQMLRIWEIPVEEPDVF